MKKLTITTKNGNIYEFIGLYRNTRGGFAHDAVVFINECEEMRATCNYINRTWENYNYQLAFITAIYNEVDAIREAVKREFMAANNYKKLTAARRAAWLEECDKNARLQELRTVAEALQRCGGVSVNLAETKNA